MALPSEAQGPMGAGGSQGGYQAPNNPAPVSGPGAMSARTDGGPQAIAQLANAKYGEQSAFRQIQQGAPMASGPSPSGGPPPSAFAQAAGGGGVQPVPFSAPTQRPGEPVTSGAARGAGPGTEALNTSPTTNQQDFIALRPALPMLQFLANLPGAHPGSQQFVRYLQSGGLPSQQAAGQTPPGVANPAVFGGSQNGPSQ
jgi:hypothetical protein